MAADRGPLHILVIADRDWEHPQGGGSGALMRAYVARWLEWGHRITVVSSAFPGARGEDNRGALTFHRGGTLKTAVPHAFRRVRSGAGADADVALEMINGVFFFTPLWLRIPCVTCVQHLSAGAQYRHEFGRLGTPLGLVAETLPLRHLYADRPLVTVSEATAEALVAGGAPRSQIFVSYAGVEPEEFASVAKTPEPSLVHLGRLKRYKNIESILDALEAIEGARLDLVGEGDHRDALVREIERRGLTDRVTLHGFVDEGRKRELLGRAWVNVMASTAEGWGLSVTEAGACGTTSAAVAVGGLAESVQHERTGLLASGAEDLPDTVRRLIDDHDLRARLAAGARDRARELTWEVGAEQVLDRLREVRAEEGQQISPLRRLAGSDTGRAGGLAAAAMATNVIGLAVSIAFARLLGGDGYGSVAALVAAFLILAIPGQALQVAVARTISADRDNVTLDPRRLIRAFALATVAVAAASAVLREPLAAVIGVDGDPWAAAAVPTSACVWMLLSIERGVLQGTGHYRAVGLSLVAEGAARLVAGTALILAGLGVTGAFLGTGLSVAGVALAVLPLSTREMADGPVHGRGLRDIARGALVPLAALTLFAWLQNIDVIVVKHQALSDDAASSYAAASVAAKMVIWLSVGLGLFLLPEAARRARSGEDARPILARTLAIVAIVAVPMIVAYSVVGRQILEIVFGPDLGQAGGALPVLGLAMSMLACVYLAVQFLLGVGRVAFLLGLAAIAVVEPLALLVAAPNLTDIALTMLALTAVLAAGLVIPALQRAADTPVAEEAS